MGYRHSEIAGLVGCSIGCSKSQVHRARRRLQAMLLGETHGREHVHETLYWEAFQLRLGRELVEEE
jgi:hypothetical protein